MKLQVVYDQEGNIVATAAAGGNREVGSEPRAGVNQSVGEIELPGEYSEGSILEIHEQFRVEGQPGNLSLVSRQP